MKKTIISSVVLSVLSFGSASYALDANTLANNYNEINGSSSSKEQLNSQQLEVVNKYAPIVFQNTNKKANPEAWDFLTSFDFDGDMRANNNEENLRSKKYQLPATMYYSLIESNTHYFITYSLYHPLDWDTLPAVIPYTWHENDMENIQVVVRKQNNDLVEKVVMMATQAHLDTELCTEIDSVIKSSGIKTVNDKNLVLLTDNLEPNGTHPAIFTESGGHGIHNIKAVSEKFSQMLPPKIKEGFTFIPSKDNTGEIYSANQSKYNYQLKSTYDTLWSYYVNKANIGKDKLVSGAFNYKDDDINYQDIPRFFNSDRVSGPGKSDAGILPFAFSYSLTSKDLGSIFFNPAKKYAQTLKIRGQWSKDYVYNPYIKDFKKFIAKK